MSDDDACLWRSQCSRWNVRRWAGERAEVALAGILPVEGAATEAPVAASKDDNGATSITITGGRDRDGKLPAIPRGIFDILSVRVLPMILVKGTELAREPMLAAVGVTLAIGVPLGVEPAVEAPDWFDHGEAGSVCAL